MAKVIPIFRKAWRAQGYPEPSYNPNDTVIFYKTIKCDTSGFKKLIEKELKDGRDSVTEE